VRVITCEFLAGVVDSRDFPPATLPEVVFLGRSNVGKSSLINALLGRRGLARTSSTPGRTRQVNFFRVNDACLFVDLPGYGFAKVAKSTRERWRILVEACLERPSPARLGVLIVDARLPPTPLDREMRAWLEDRGMPYLIAATKTDKLSRNQLNRSLKTHLHEVHRPDRLIPCSAETRDGIPRIWAAIDGMLNETKPTYRA
jgi:GTP-binding protein